LSKTGLTVTLAGQYYEVDSPWGSGIPGRQFTSISHIATDSRDRVYVFQRADPPVAVFDQAGQFFTSWGDGAIADAHGIFITADDRVFLVDRDGHQVMAFTTDGRLMLTLGDRRKPRLQAPFNHPSDIAVGPAGRIYVSDGYGNAAFHCFEPDGELVWTRGKPGRGPGEFVTPHGIWVDPRGRILIADRDNDRIQLFDMDGNYLEEWGGLYHPMDIFVDKQGQVYVTEQVPRMTVFASDGRLIGRCRNRRISHSVWIDSRGDIYLPGQPTAPQVPDRVEKLVHRNGAASQEQEKK